MTNAALPRWATEELATTEATDEIHLATRRSDGSLRRARIVWVVRHGGAVYVRSVNGTAAAWYRGVQTRHAGHLSNGSLERDIMFVEAGANADGAASLDDTLDAAYRAKYRRWPGPVEHIVSDTARATTLRLDPA